MAVWSYWNQILADVLINLLEQFILFPCVRFQQNIDQVIFQYPNAQCSVYHHLMFPVSFFFVQFRLGITDDVLSKVADIDCAVYIRQRHFDHPQGNMPDLFHPPADIRSFIMSDPAFVQVDVHPCVRCRQSGLFFYNHWI